MIKKLRVICLVLFFSLVGGIFHAYAYSMQRNNLDVAVTKVAEVQPTEFVTLPNNHLTLSYVVYGTTVEKSNLEAVEDFIEEEDETELLPYKKTTEPSTYFVAHYRSQSTEAYHNHLAKSWQKGRHFSFPSSASKSVLFCVFRI